MRPAQRAPDRDRVHYSAQSTAGPFSTRPVRGRWAAHLVTFPRPVDALSLPKHTERTPPRPPGLVSPPLLLLPPRPRPCSVERGSIKRAADARGQCLLSQCRTPLLRAARGRVATRRVHARLRAHRRAPTFNAISSIDFRPGRHRAAADGRPRQGADPQARTVNGRELRPQYNEWFITIPAGSTCKRGRNTVRVRVQRASTAPTARASHRYRRHVPDGRVYPYSASRAGGRAPTRCSPASTSPT